MRSVGSSQYEMSVVGENGAVLSRFCACANVCTKSEEARFVRLQGVANPIGLNIEPTNSTRSFTPVTTTQ